MIYLYGITDATVSPAGEGVGGAALAVVSVGRLAGIVSEHDRLQAEPSLETAWAHEEVVERLMAEAPVLPVRMGSLLGDRHAVAALLGERREELEAGLDRVRGAVELAVRARAHEHEPVGQSTRSKVPRTGTQYLLERLGSRARLADLETQVDDALAPLARERVRLSGLGANGTIRTAYLVESEDVASFAARVDRLDGDLEHVSLTCTGPWPPYSFASSGESS